jgi:hypothetical protein
VDAERLKYRQRIFYGLYTVVAAVMLFGVYIFVTFEETAIETVPPAEDVVVFAPLTPTPFPTPFPTNTASVEVPSSWNQGFSELMATKCSQCHSGSGALGGLDLSTYAGLFEGGVSGPAVLPGEPNESPLVVIQSEGNHPGQLSGEELALIRAWIEDGAPEE